MSPNRRGEPSVLHCGECGAQLAHDQRYCLQCGARRGALPAHVAGLFAGIVERGRRVATPSNPDGESLIPQTHWYDSWVQAPRAAATAVLSMLGFGVVVGSLVTGSVASVLGPTIVAVSPASQNASQLSQAAGGGSDSSGGGGPRTITVTTPALSSNSGSGGGFDTGGGATSTTAATLTPTNNAPPIKHVFLVMLSEQSYHQTFEKPRSDPYLAKTLAAKGEVLQSYYAVAGGELANEIAAVSGQGPTPNTVKNCPQYTDVVPGGSGAAGQVLGLGCVYPPTAKTLADQVTADGLQWKAYVQTKGTGKAAQLEACKHPKIGAHDGATPTARDPYVTWRNPFLYFHSLLAGGPCPKNDVPLTRLATDLKSVSTTPTLSYVVADPCDDGSDTPCAPGAKAGPAAADRFLKSVIPGILASAAYKADGMIAITYDQAPQTGPNADHYSCCGNPQSYPNLVGFTDTNGTGGPTGPSGPSGPTGDSPNLGLSNGQTSATGGGGLVGMLLLSKYVTPGVPQVTAFFNHYSLLASIEDAFGFKRLGYAAARSLPTFSQGAWDAYSGGGF